MTFFDRFLWDKWKPRIEIIAIIGAALFALFTWGVDAWRLSSPNWAVSFGKVSELTGVVENDLFKMCKTADCADASACMIQSKIITKNEARTPLNVGDTTLSFYNFEKATVAAFVNQSSYQRFTSTCSYSKSNECVTPFEEIKIGQVDKQPLYPGQEAWRPFTIEIHPSLMKSNLSLDSFAESNSILIVAKQDVSPKTLIPFQNPKQSFATFILPNLCNKARHSSNNSDAISSIETIKVIIADG